MRRRTLTGCCLLLPLACCSQPEPTPNLPERRPQDACAALHAAPAHEWPEHLATVHNLGAAAEPFLIDQIENEPTAPGAQASVALLGRIGTAKATELCARLVDERTHLATEAALALGELPATDHAHTTLLACTRDRHGDITLRTAAACSLARHGDRTTAPPFLAAITRAGTPAGQPDERNLGLPPKSRWALERYFVQRLLQQLGHDDLASELDPDAPWPTLTALAPRVQNRLTNNH